MVRGCLGGFWIPWSVAIAGISDVEAAPIVFPALLVQFSVDEQPPGGLTCTPWP